MEFDNVFSVEIRYYKTKDAFANTATLQYITLNGAFKEHIDVIDKNDIPELVEFINDNWDGRDMYKYS